MDQICTISVPIKGVQKIGVKRDKIISIDPLGERIQGKAHSILGQAIQM